ncbi:hypothetical protein JZ751_021387 [Albula glossodonta]|uniref:Uncharacterized protein n=1 Tax=Albula glossodonta TaxID=121402 RepID=A0A8T2NJI5_9TELE|nr:hypothetical protein JZ751_021387 [Albula glossodonta]
MPPQTASTETDWECCFRDGAKRCPQRRRLLKLVFHTGFKPASPLMEMCCRVLGRGYTKARKRALIGVSSLCLCEHPPPPPHPYTGRILLVPAAVRFCAQIWTLGLLQLLVLFGDQNGVSMQTLQPSRTWCEEPFWHHACPSLRPVSPVQDDTLDTTLNGKLQQVSEGRSICIQSRDDINLRDSSTFLLCFTFIIISERAEQSPFQLI